MTTLLPVWFTSDFGFSTLCCAVTAAVYNTDADDGNCDVFNMSMIKTGPERVARGFAVCIDNIDRLFE